jgi:hypothetical protein
MDVSDETDLEFDYAKLFFDAFKGDMYTREEMSVSYMYRLHI